MVSHRRLFRCAGALLALAPCSTMLMADETLDNGVTGVGRLEVIVQDAGDAWDLILTPEDAPDAPENVMCELVSFVELGNSGEFDYLMDSTTEVAALDESGAVVSSGTFMGPNGPIAWTSRATVPQGRLSFVTQLEFSSAEPFGTVRIAHYLDEDVRGSNDDLLVQQGTPGTSDFQLLTVDGETDLGLAHAIDLESLTGATFSGWAASACCGMPWSGDPVQWSPSGYVFGLEPAVDARFPGQPTYGPADISSAFAVVLDPGATYAVVRVTVGGLDRIGDPEDQDETTDTDQDGDPDVTDCADSDPTRYTGAVEACDTVDSDCNGSLTDSFPNADGDSLPDCVDPDDDNDGDNDSSDCADTDPSRHTGAIEACDAVDSDCDGSLVDGFSNWDGDSEPDCIDGDDDNDGDIDLSDCDDTNPRRYTGNVEQCDAEDSDCDGSLVDEFSNADGDGLPDCIEADDDNDGDNDPTDCNDVDPTVYTGAAEACDAVDSDCDGSLVDGYPDNEGDGYPNCMDPDDDNDSIADEADNCPRTANTDQLNFDADSQGDLCDDDDDNDGDADSSDCNDNDASIYTGAPESCDGVDSDCDGSLVDRFADFDGDGTPDCVDADDDNDGDTDESDCDDADPSIHTGAAEACDSIDSDCDGSLIDEFANSDTDSFPNCIDEDDDDDTLADSKDNCPRVANPDQLNTDRDSQGDVCDEDDDNDGIVDSDDNCQLDVNPDQKDLDGDRLGNVCDEDDDGDGDADATDCNDANASIHHDAPESCDAIDSDCDNDLVDEAEDTDSDLSPDCIDPDDDADGFADERDNCRTVVNPDQLNTDGDASGDACDLDDDNDGDADETDCDDTDASIHHGASESCDSIDSDCNGSVVDEDSDFDHDLSPDCVDADDDNDGDPDLSDCNDEDAAIHNGAVEACDEIDSDCNGSILDSFGDNDRDSSPDCVDADDDNDGDPDLTDCDDVDSSIFTGAPESCDSVDSDCNGSLVDSFGDHDRDSSPDCVDTDDDNDGDADETDCNDADATVYNGALESCDSVDSDCNGSAIDTYEDHDGDATPDCIDADDDNDSVADSADNCVTMSNLEQVDTDGDGKGDVCDADDDGDREGDASDNCPQVENERQEDQDNDGLGDACDPDDDNDGIEDGADNCALEPNPGQDDFDGDGIGNDCDVCVGDPANDVDGDGVCGDVDVCPTDADAGQEDLDHDGRGDVCDTDVDGDGYLVGTDCDDRDASGGATTTFYADADGDGRGDASSAVSLCAFEAPAGYVKDSSDNCPAVANADQADVDGDGLGDACDSVRDDAELEGGTAACSVAPESSSSPAGLGWTTLLAASALWLRRRSRG